MDLGTFIRGFFGLKHPKPDRCDDCAKSPEHFWPEESFEERENSAADDIFFHDSHFSSIEPMHPFSIFQSMEDAFRDFFSFHFRISLDSFGTEEASKDREENPRDYLLNPSEGNFADFWGREHRRNGYLEFPNIESYQEPASPRDLVLKPSYRDPPKSVGSAQRRDSDLDGAHSAEILQEFPQQSKFNSSFRKSVSTKIIIGSGVVEEHRTVKDSSGNEVTTVRKSIGDQSYSVSLHKNSEGLNEKKEDFVNLDEKDIPKFEEKWRRMKGDVSHTPRNDVLLQGPDSMVQRPFGDAQYSSIFKKLFRF